jgi:small-conductance mechanosensitive channel
MNFKKFLGISEKVFANDPFFSAAVLAAGLVAGIVASRVVLYILRRWQRTETLQRFNIKTIYLKKPIHSLLPALCIMISYAFLRIPEGAGHVADHFINLWIIGSCGWLAVAVVRTAKDVLLSRYDITIKDNLQVRRIYTQVDVIEKIVIVALVLVTVSFMLMTFESVRRIGTGMLASAGVVGIVIGFAAQKTLGNFIAGIQIALTEPIRIDDVVVVESEWGRIEEITLTYVVVRIWDLRRLVLPISYFIEKPFQNWTRVSADILGSVYIYADYTVPVQELRKELTRVLRQSSYWDQKVNALQVTGATERTVEIRALMSAASSPDAWNLRCEVREKLLEFFQKNYLEALPRTRIEFGRKEKE